MADPTTGAPPSPSDAAAPSASTESDSDGRSAKDILLRVLPFTAAIKRKEDAQQARVQERINSVLLQEAVENPEIFSSPEVRKSFERSYGKKAAGHIGEVLGSIAQRQIAGRNAFSKIVEEFGGNFDAAASAARARGVEVPKDVNEWQSRRMYGPEVAGAETKARSDAEFRAFLDQFPSRLAAELAKTRAVGKTENELKVEGAQQMRPVEVETARERARVTEAAQTEGALTRENLLRPGRVETARQTTAAQTEARETVQETFAIRTEERAEGRRMMAKARQAANDDAGFAQQYSALKSGLARTRDAVTSLTDNPVKALSGLQWLGVQLGKRDRNNPNAIKYAAIQSFQALAPNLAKIFGDSGNVGQAEREAIVRDLTPNMRDTDTSAANKLTILEAMVDDIAEGRKANLSADAIAARVRERYQGFLGAMSEAPAPTVDTPQPRPVPSTPSGPPPPDAASSPAPSPQGAGVTPPIPPAPAGTPPSASGPAPAAPAAAPTDPLEAAKARLRARGVPIP